MQQSRRPEQWPTTMKNPLATKCYKDTLLCCASTLSLHHHHTTITNEKAVLPCREQALLQALRVRRTSVAKTSARATRQRKMWRHAWRRRQTPLPEYVCGKHPGLANRCGFGGRAAASDKELPFHTGRCRPVERFSTTKRPPTCAGRIINLILPMRISLERSLTYS